MTVETATVVSTAVPPKKRDYNSSGCCNGELNIMEQQQQSSLQTVRQQQDSPPLSSPSPIPHPALAALASKTAPMRSSGFMITDILSGAAQGLPLPMPLVPMQHRVPSPHSPARSSEDDAASEDGEGGLAAIFSSFMQFGLGWMYLGWRQSLFCLLFGHLFLNPCWTSLDKLGSLVKLWYLIILDKSWGRVLIFHAN